MKIDRPGGVMSQAAVADVRCGAAQRRPTDRVHERCLRSACTRDTSAICRPRVSLADILIVGLNADESVRRNKGPARPINRQEERAEVVAALACVDGVVIFDEDTPDAIIKLVQPDVLVKGADWPADQIVGRDTVEARGGRVVLIPVEQGYSTTAIVEKIRNA